MSQQPLRNEQPEGRRDIGAELLAEQMARLAISYALFPQPSYQRSVVSFTSVGDVLRRSLTCVYYWHISGDDKRGDILTTLLKGSPQDGLHWNDSAPLALGREKLGLFDLDVTTPVVAGKKPIPLGFVTFLTAKAYP
jgi:hypothetical protein